jgi:serine phosphatase RsbU (regulator of sigma subunit)
MSLLVVEDDRAVGSAIASALRNLGHEVAKAASPRTAAESCGNSPVEMVVSDNPVWATALATEFAFIPVVVATRTHSDKDLMAYLRAGITDVWQVPPDPAEIADRAPRILERARSASSQAAKRLEQHVADLNRDQRAGRYIQLGMLPPNPMAIDRYRFQHRIKPSMILSGDFVDYFRIGEGHFGFYVADVSGHGASSAFVTVLLKNFSRRLRREYRPSMLEAPGEILQWLNRELLDQKMDKHVAMFLAVGDLQGNTLRFANAGNFPPAIHVGASGARYLEQKGKPIGLFEDVEYATDTIVLARGDQLVIFTDGILELVGDGALAERERALLEAVEQSMDSERIWQRLGVAESDSPDDITCLSVVRED